MNEELQKALAQLLSKTSEGISTAGDFLVAELPDVIQQLLMWHGIKSLLLCLLGLIILISLPYQIKKMISLIPNKIKEGEADNWYWKDANRGYRTLGLQIEKTEGAALFSTAIVASSIAEVIAIVSLINITWLQIWIAPKVWLLEYAAKLTN